MAHLCDRKWNKLYLEMLAIAGREMGSQDECRGYSPNCAMCQLRKVCISRQLMELIAPCKFPLFVALVSKDIQGIISTAGVSEKLLDTFCKCGLCFVKRLGLFLSSFWYMVV